MHKIQYPAGDKRKAFEKDYIQLFEPLKAEFNKLKSNQVFGWSFEKLLITDFRSLTKKAVILTRRHFNGAAIANIFRYGEYQGKISHFFMKNGDQLKLSACYYCGLEYINAYEDVGDYRDGLEFFNKADEMELQTIMGIGPELARKILAARPVASLKAIESITWLHKNIKRQFCDYKNREKNYRSHFTLDHLLTQEKYPYFALSLYNLIPSCYTCNCKLKGKLGLGKLANLPFLSPSSEKFDVPEQVRFKLFHEGNSPGKVMNVHDFSIRIEFKPPGSIYKTYADVFRLHGRYPFHKDKALELILKSRRYSPAKIKELQKYTGTTQVQIREDIFGRDLFSQDSEHLPFAKLRKDIAAALKITNIV